MLLPLIMLHFINAMTSADTQQLKWRLPVKVKTCFFNRHRSESRREEKQWPHPDLPQGRILMFFKLFSSFCRLKCSKHAASRLSVRLRLSFLTSQMSIFSKDLLVFESPWVHALKITSFRGKGTLMKWNFALVTLFAFGSVVWKQPFGHNWL